MTRVAIVGAGIGQEHLRAYLRLPEQFTVSALCDLDRDRAEAALAAEAATGVRIVGHVSRLFDDPELDLIDICLPPHLHFEVAQGALLAGKHVVCEKPLVTSFRDADRLAEIALQAERRVFPVFQYRFGTAFSRLRALREAGLLGRPVLASLETHWNRGADYYAVDWRGTWKGEHGGAVLGHAIHSHDLLCHLFGPVARLSAVCTTRVNPIEVEDCAAISFEMENGALATSSVTLGAANDTSRLRLIYDYLTAESGSAPYAPAEDTWTFTSRDPEGQERVDAVIQSVTAAPAGFEGFLLEIANTLAGQPATPVTLPEARRSLELVTAIYLSARTERPVSLPLPLNGPGYDGWAP